LAVMLALILVKNTERRLTSVTTRARPVGELLQDLVNRVSHRGGETLGIMQQASVTLHQVLLLTRLRQMSPCTSSDLAANLNLSLPAVSQAIDRLAQLGLVTRVEDAADRRRKRLATSKKADALLDRLLSARSTEYGVGLARLPADLRRRFATVLRQVLSQRSLDLAGNACTLHGRIHRRRQDPDRPS
jgi:DNA-binding MarR family transcriptional regulator